MPIQPLAISVFISQRVVRKFLLTLLQDDEEMARELGETTGEFFRVRAEPGPKFTSKTPARPPPPEHHSPGPRAKGALQNVFGKVRDFV